MNSSNKDDLKIQIFGKIWGIFSLFLDIFVENGSLRYWIISACYSFWNKLCKAIEKN